MGSYIDKDRSKSDFDHDNLKLALNKNNTVDNRSRT